MPSITWYLLAAFAPVAWKRRLSQVVQRKLGAFLSDRGLVEIDVDQRVRKGVTNEPNCIEPGSHLGTNDPQRPRYGNTAG